MQRYWVNLLHIYQPPWQDQQLVLEMLQNSYLYTIQTLEQRPEMHLTLNICGSLTEHLARQGKQDFFDRIRKLVNNGQIELVGSAMYHPILPLIPADEVKRQIALNEDINSHYFKEEWTAASSRYGSRGFFLPELAYSADVAQIVKDAGFQWLVLDEIGFRGVTQIDWKQKYIEQKSGVQLLIRKNFRTEETFEVVTKSNDDYLVSISDGEIYRDTLPSNQEGLQHWDRFFPFLEQGLTTLTAGEYFKKLDEQKVLSQQVNPNSSSWRTTQEEERLGSAYHNWLTPGDEIHKRLWELSHEVGELLKTYAGDRNMPFIRQEFDRALSSCTWWWVDGRDLGYSPGEVNKGLNVLINVVRSFGKLPGKLRLKFEKDYSELIYLIWERHWQQYI